MPFLPHQRKPTSDALEHKPTALAPSRRAAAGGQLGGLSQFIGGNPSALATGTASLPAVELMANLTDVGDALGGSDGGNLSVDNASSNSSMDDQMPGFSKQFPETTQNGVPPLPVGEIKVNATKPAINCPIDASKTSAQIAAISAAQKGQTSIKSGGGINHGLFVCKTDGKVSLTERHGEEVVDPLTQKKKKSVYVDQVDLAFGYKDAKIYIAKEYAERSDKTYYNRTLAHERLHLTDAKFSQGTIALQSRWLINNLSNATIGHLPSKSKPIQVAHYDRNKAAKRVAVTVGAPWIKDLRKTTAARDSKSEYCRVMSKGKKWLGNHQNLCKPTKGHDHSDDDGHGH